MTTEKLNLISPNFIAKALASQRQRTPQDPIIAPRLKVAMCPQWPGAARPMNLAISALPIPSRLLPGTRKVPISTTCSPNVNWPGPFVMALAHPSTILPPCNGPTRPMTRVNWKHEQCSVISTCQAMAQPEMLVAPWAITSVLRRKVKPWLRRDLPSNIPTGSTSIKILNRPSIGPSFQPTAAMPWAN